MFTNTKLELYGKFSQRTALQKNSTDRSTASANLVPSLLPEEEDSAAQGENIEASMLAAVENGNERAVRRYLSRGVSIDAKDGFQRTALHIASKSRQPNLVTFLLEQGANREDTDWFKQTAFYYAIMNRDDVMVGLLSANVAGGPTVPSPTRGTSASNS